MPTHFVNSQNPSVSCKNKVEKSYSRHTVNPIYTRETYNRCEGASKMLKGITGSSFCDWGEDALGKADDATGVLCSRALWLGGGVDGKADRSRGVLFMVSSHVQDSAEHRCPT